MSFFTTNLRWNTVDVRGEDGLLHMGRVTDCASEGLMVDFRCGTTPRLVPFGQVYLSKLDWRKNHPVIAEDQPIELLIRHSSETSAKWYCGTLLTGDFADPSFALVRATAATGTWLQIVHVEHIRERHNLDQFLLEKDQFVKEEIQLPSGISSGAPSPQPYKTAPSDQHFVDAFNETCSGKQMMATHIDGGTLHVLKLTDRHRWNFVLDYRDSCPEVKEEQLVHMYGAKPGAACSTIDVELVNWCGYDLRTYEEYAALEKHHTEVKSLRICQHALNDSMYRRSHPNYAARINRTLPNEVLAEIFSFQDGMAQVKIRRVCSRWNDILNTCPDLAGVLRLPHDICDIDGFVCTPASINGQGDVALVGHEPVGPLPTGSSTCSGPEWNQAGVSGNVSGNQSVDTGGGVGDVTANGQVSPDMQGSGPSAVAAVAVADTRPHPAPETRRDRLDGIVSRLGQARGGLPTPAGSGIVDMRQHDSVEMREERDDNSAVLWSRSTAGQTDPICVSPRIIVNSSLDNSRDHGGKKGQYHSMMCSGRLFRLIHQEHNLSHLETLILANISWQWPAFFAPTTSDPFGSFLSHVCQELNLFASVCRSLVLTNVTVALSGVRLADSSMFATRRDPEPLDASLTVYITKGRVEGELSVEALWNRIDSSLPRLTEPDIIYWNELMADILDADLLEQLVKILNVCQSSDPRRDNRFCGKEWSARDLADLDLQKLNRITLYSLFKACCDEKLVIAMKAW